MINVSSEYFNSINAPMRLQANFVIGLGVENTEMAQNSVYSDNGHMRYSNVNSLKNLYATNKIYTTAEPNMYILDGLHEITPSQDTFQGYCSNLVSGDDSTFSATPIIYITSDNEYDLIGFTIKFDEENNDYPTDFDIEYYSKAGALLRKANITNNTQTQYIDDVETSRVNKIAVKFYKTHNYGRRIRVTRITLGIYEEIYGGGGANTIKSVSHITEISPLSKEIPTNNFSFVIFDEKGLYNAENPTGIWKYTKKGQIATLKYIQTLENGKTESVVGGRFYLTDRPSTEDTDAKFEAVSRLESLEQTYNEGKYYVNGRSYYNLFVDLFTYAGLENGEYEIDEDLKNISTLIPLPKENVKTCIQLLCQSCGKIAYEDTTGKIWIKNSNSTIDEYNLALNQNYSYPKYTLETANVRNIIMTKYTPTVSKETSELAKTAFTLTGQSEVVVAYDLSTNHTYTITGGTVTGGEFYGYCCKLKITPSADTNSIELTISGNKIDITDVNLIYPINSNGSDCELDFKMLSQDNVANILFPIYKKYLSEQKRYEISYRGNPELRANDIIQIATRFSEQINAMILKSSYEWNNGASGTLELKNYANQTSNA